MQTFESPEPISVSLEFAVANVEIIATNRFDTTVDVQPTNPANKGDVAAAAQVTVDFASGRLRVAQERSFGTWRPWAQNSVDVRIELPAGSSVDGSGGIAKVNCDGALRSCRYKTGKGRLYVEEAGSVWLHAGSADVEVGHAREHLDVKTNGAVVVGRVDGDALIKNAHGSTKLFEVTGNLRVNAAHGDVDVDHTHADAVLKSAKGNVTIALAERGSIVAETAKGDVEIGVRSGVAVWIDATTAFGRVNNDLETAGPPVSGEHTIELRARTAHGDVTVHRAIADAR